MTAYTYGVYDLFHIGHINLFKKIKENCDKLIVGVHNDEQVITYKNAPIILYRDRLEIIRCCKYVDEVIPYATEKELIDILCSYPIDVRIIGEEYKDQQFTGYELPMAVYFNTRRHSFSTTELRKRVAEAKTI